MPIYLRTFYFKRLQKHFKYEAEEIKKAQQSNKSSIPSYKNDNFDIYYWIIPHKNNLMENYNG